MKHRASKSLGVRCFPCPLFSQRLPDRKRKRFLASARNDDAGRRHTPSFPWKEVPRRGGGWLPKRDEKNGKQPCSRFVIPSAAEGSFSFAVFFFLCTYICMKHRASKSLEVRCFPCPLFSHRLPDRKRKRFLASARNDDAGRRHTPSFPWKEVPRRGGGWLPKRDEKNGKQPCSRFVIPSAAEGSFSFAVFFFLCTYICMKHRASKSLEVRCFPCPLFSHRLPDRKRKRFLASARNDDAGRRHTPSFPWKEVPRRGGSWLTP